MLTQVTAAVASLWLPGNVRGDLLGRCVFRRTDSPHHCGYSGQHTCSSQCIITQDCLFRDGFAQVTSIWRGSIAGYGSLTSLARRDPASEDSGWRVATGWGLTPLRLGTRLTQNPHFTLKKC